MGCFNWQNYKKVLIVLYSYFFYKILSKYKPIKIIIIDIKNNNNLIIIINNKGNLIYLLITKLKTGLLILIDNKIIPKTIVNQ